MARVPVRAWLSRVVSLQSEAHKSFWRKKLHTIFRQIESRERNLENKKPFLNQLWIHPLTSREVLFKAAPISLLKQEWVIAFRNYLPMTNNPTDLATKIRGLIWPVHQGGGFSPWTTYDIKLSAHLICSGSYLGPPTLWNPALDSTRAAGGALCANQYELHQTCFTNAICILHNEREGNIGRKQLNS